MNHTIIQIGGAINKYRLNIECRDFNQTNNECFEEIYKVCYVYWNKCHEKYKRTHKESDKQEAEYTFMVDITEIIEILRPLFMVQVYQLSDRWLNKLDKKREDVVGSLPSPMYFNFLLHTVKYKLCKPNISSNFNKFLEILFTSGLEENNVTGVIPLNLEDPSENEVYDMKVLHATNEEPAISNTDIVSMVISCRE
jgi:hypothetical protein